MRDAINNKHTYASLKNREIFLGYSFIIFNTILSPKRRNPPSNRKATRGRAKSMDIQLRSNAIHGRRCRRRIYICLVLLRKYSFYPIRWRRNKATL